MCTVDRGAPTEPKVSTPSHPFAVFDPHPGAVYAVKNGGWRDVAVALNYSGKQY
jgi:hypothetical protein